MIFSLFVSCPKGLEYLLEEELTALGLQITRVSPQGVYGEGSLTVIYHLCLWSRLANRVQLILFSGEVQNQQGLYALCHQYPWQTVFAADKTLAIEFHGSSAEIRNSMFGAQVVKDGIVDQCRDLNGTRPTIDRETPEIRLHAYLKDDIITLSFDLTGYSMHQRGYRTQAGAAPIKENVAAAMLIRAKWPKLAAEGYGLYDPFCGAGTLVIEAAMMAANIAPGLIRSDQSLHHWLQHDPALWEKLRTEALADIKPMTGKLYGSDINAKAVEAALANAVNARVASFVEFTTKALVDCKAPQEKGLVICNPPYGERLGDVTQLLPVYQQFGRVLNDDYQGWQAAFLTSNPLLAKAVGLRANKQYTLYNGALECKLYCVMVDMTNQLKEHDRVHLSPGAEILVNRLKKNYSHLQKWAKRNKINCYRVYDADLPEYSYAIDIYDHYVILQEYTAPSIIPKHKVEKRSLEVQQVVQTVLSVKPENVIVKQRKQQKGSNQYEKMDKKGRTLVVTEGDAKFTVNLYDYLDTGIFLDHRPLRLRFATLPPKTRFLNCFCYTATASVHAALAGALTTNVDLSKTYLTWAEDNFRLNNLDINKHQFIHYDCLNWLKVTLDRFDVIFLDPPSFSNSKRMSETLDIQRDHEALIQAAMNLLNPNGTLYFSTNFRYFKLSSVIVDEYSVKDISAETIDIDFKRNTRIHQCFRIQKKG